MKEIRSEFTFEEYEKLKEEAGRLGISVKQLVHDRAVGTVPEDAPLTAAQILSNEMSVVREDLNEIIRRETGAKDRLYEDDMIRLELTMARVETATGDFIARVLKGAA